MDGSSRLTSMRRVSEEIPEATIQAYAGLPGVLGDAKP
jgi:hypothetical protein